MARMRSFPRPISIHQISGLQSPDADFSFGFDLFKGKGTGSLDGETQRGTGGLQDKGAGHSIKESGTACPHRQRP